MLYLVKSNTPQLRDKIIGKILSSKEITKEEMVVFDYEDDKNISNAAFEYLSLSLDGTNKAILIKNANFINAKTIEKDFEKEFENIVNAETDNILILTVEKLNKTGKLNKKFNNKFNLLEKDAPEKSELIKFIKTFFENNSIEVEYGVAENIANRLDNNFDLIITELKKLDILYTEKITNKLVDSTLLNFSRERLYTIANCVFEKDIEGVSRMIKQLISEGESTFMIADALNRVGYGFLRYFILKDKGYSDDEISKVTGWNGWMISNYSKFLPHWNNVNEIYNFYYKVIVNDSFFDFMEHQPKDGLRQMEKLLISSIARIK